MLELNKSLIYIEKINKYSDYNVCINFHRESEWCLCYETLSYKTSSCGKPKVNEIFFKSEDFIMDELKLLLIDAIKYRRNILRQILQLKKIIKFCESEDINTYTFEKEIKDLKFKYNIK